jgi:hypothetical protein
MNAYNPPVKIYSESMNIAQIVNNLKSIVQGIADNADNMLLAHLPRQRSTFVAQFGQIVEQVALDDLDWLNITTSLHDWLAKLPKANDWYRQQLSHTSVLRTHLCINGQPDPDNALRSDLQHAINHCYQTLLFALKKWRWFGAFKDDPTLDLIYDDIERQRDLHLVGGGL